MKTVTSEMASGAAIAKALQDADKSLYMLNITVTAIKEHKGSWAIKVTTYYRKNEKEFNRSKWYSIPKVV